MNAIAPSSKWRTSGVSATAPGWSRAPHGSEAMDDRQVALVSERYAFSLSGSSFRSSRSSAHRQAGPRTSYTPHAGRVPSSAKTSFYRTRTKRWIDVAAGSILLLLVSPILIGAMTWIAVDTRANPLYRQSRVGYGGSTFTLFKLRTMTPSPSSHLLWLNDEHGVRRHKIRNDPRVTRSGRFLRRTSIDELPQLWNVLRGDMSLVGPRPELPEIVTTYQPWQHARHAVRPGLTGWWQVSGRSDRPMHEHTDLDLYYVDNLGLRLDILITAKTVSVVLKGLGAF